MLLRFILFLYIFYSCVRNKQNIEFFYSYNRSIPCVTTDDGRITALPRTICFFYSLDCVFLFIILLFIYLRLRYSLYFDCRHSYSTDRISKFIDYTFYSYHAIQILSISICFYVLIVYLYPFT